MSMLYKLAISAVGGALLIVLFTPEIQRFLTRLTSSSETITVADNSTVEEYGATDTQRELEIVTLLGFDSIPPSLIPSSLRRTRPRHGWNPESLSWDSTSTVTGGPTQ